MISRYLVYYCVREPPFWLRTVIGEISGDLKIAADQAMWTSCTASLISVAVPPIKPHKNRWYGRRVCTEDHHAVPGGVVIRPSRSGTVQVTIRDQNGASQRFQAVGASTGRDLHDTTSSASISIRGEISTNLVTPRYREIKRDRVG